MVDKLKAKVVEVKRLAGDDFILKIRLLKKFNFNAGQFAMLTVGGKARPFSIASAPYEKNLEFIIKRHENGEVTPKLYALKSGDEIEISGPYGVFTVNDKFKDLVFLAGGTGIAPFRGMIRDTLETNKNAKITLVYGFSNNCIEEEEWGKLSREYENFKLHICCSQKMKGWKGPVCNVNDILPKIFKFSKDKIFYICGPDIMIKTCKEDLMKKLKFKESQIHIEPWPHPKTENKSQEVTGKKLKIGWFSFSCCEDSTIVFTELLNDHYAEWSKLVDFQHVRVLKSKNKLEGLDVAFVEGAIASKSDEDKLKEIRKNCKKLVAIGSCACTGMPSAQRNTFNKDQLKQIDFLLKKFHHAKKVKKLEECIKVDERVPGCPMNEAVFLETLNKMLKEFKIVK